MLGLPSVSLVTSGRGSRASCVGALFSSRSRSLKRSAPLESGDILARPPTIRGGTKETRDDDACFD